MRHDGNPPPDPSRTRELDGETGVDPPEEWTAGPVAAPDFDEIVQLYARRLYLLAYRLTANRAEAEDLSQETLVRGYLAIERFRGESDFYTYLYRTLLNLWKNQIRSRRRWRLVSLGSDPRRDAREAENGAMPARDLRDPSPGPHERLVESEQSARLHKALLELDPDFRAVLILRVAEGLEYEEIAEALGIPVGTVRSRLARARSRIRDLMSER